MHAVWPAGWWHLGACMHILLPAASGLLSGGRCPPQVYHSVQSDAPAHAAGQPAVLRREIADMERMVENKYRR